MLQQERDSHSHTRDKLEIAREETAAANDHATWCNDLSRQAVLELQARLHAAEAELHTAKSNRQDALRYAEGMYMQTSAMAQESKREVDRSLYLQHEVSSLSRAPLFFSHSPLFMHSVSVSVFLFYTRFLSLDRTHIYGVSLTLAVFHYLRCSDCSMRSSGLYV